MGSRVTPGPQQVNGYFEWEFAPSVR